MHDLLIIHRSVILAMSVLNFNTPNHDADKNELSVVALHVSHVAF